MLVRLPSMGGMDSISLLRKSRVFNRLIPSNPATFKALMRFSLAIKISSPCSSYNAFGMNVKLPSVSPVNRVLTYSRVGSMHSPIVGNVQFAQRIQHTKLEGQIREQIVGQIEMCDARELRDEWMHLTNGIVGQHQLRYQLRHVLQADDRV